MFADWYNKKRDEERRKIKENSKYKLNNRGIWWMIVHTTLQGIVMKYQMELCAADFDFKIICVLHKTIEKDLMMCALQK